LIVIFLIRPNFAVNAGNALLNSVGSSKAKGSAQMLADQGSKVANFQVSLQGLTSHLRYTVTVDEGKCGGKVLATIKKEVTPDGNGNAQATVSYEDLSKIQQQGSVWLNVHQGDAAGPTVACGEVRLNSGQPPNTTNNNTAVPGTGGTQTVVPGNAPNTVTNLPETGVAPANSDSYDNYKYPRRR